MPIHSCELPGGGSGYQWGGKGRCYPERGGAERQAAAAHAAGWTGDAEAPVAAGIILREPGGRVLFLLRSDSATDHPNTWCWPGGTIEPGENPMAAARRELREETGYDYSGPLAPLDNRDGFVTFYGTVDDEFEPTLNDEHDDAYWTEPTDLRLIGGPEGRYMHPGVLATIQDKVGEIESLQPAMDGEFEESKHPRAENGQFGSGGGGSVKPKGKAMGFNKYSSETAAYKDAPMGDILDTAQVKALKADLKEQGRLNDDGTVSLYHVTLPDRVNSIREHGLVPAAAGASGQTWESDHAKYATYFHSDPEIAQEQAEQGEASVVEVRIPLTTKTLSRMLPDEDMSEDPKDGVKLLASGGPIAFVGGVPAEAVSVKNQPAMDDHLAFDRNSVRHIDQDGRLHAALNNISKANVCPYFGREIPGWQELGLDPDKIYQMLRDPEELAKPETIRSFNNLPLLSEHVPVTSKTYDGHKPHLVVGSLGTDAEWTPPYMRNSLVVWAKDHVDGIHSEKKRELSSAYYYRPDMTPGVFKGVRYDGVMRDIIANHVVLCEDGRAGDDVMVGDAMPKGLRGGSFVAMDAEFKESDHPRGENGQFGAGGGGSSGGEHKMLKERHEKYGHWSGMPVQTPDGPGEIMAEGSDDVHVKTKDGVKLYKKLDVKPDYSSESGHKIEKKESESFTAGLVNEAKRWRDMAADPKNKQMRSRYLQEARSYESKAKKAQKDHEKKFGGSGTQPAQDSKEKLMSKTVLTRKAAAVEGALTVFLRPLLAQDEQINLAPLLKGIDAKNYKAKKPALAVSLQRLTAGKLAQDADLEGMHKFLDSLDGLRDTMVEHEATEDEEDPILTAGSPLDGDEPAASDDDPCAAVLALLDDKVDADTLGQIKSILQPPAGDEEEDMLGAEDNDDNVEPDKENDGGANPGTGAADEEEEEMKVTPAAMDAAIQAAVAKTALRIQRQQRELREAESFVRPWVGELVAMDSADAVYASALKAMGVDTKGVHPSAYRTIIKMQPLPGARRTSIPTIAADSAMVAGYADRFPGADRIQTL